MLTIWLVETTENHIVLGYFCKGDLIRLFLLLFLFLFYSLFQPLLFYCIESFYVIFRKANHDLVSISIGGLKYCSELKLSYWIFGSLIYFSIRGRKSRVNQALVNGVMELLHMTKWALLRKEQTFSRIIIWLFGLKLIVKSTKWLTWISSEELNDLFGSDCKNEAVL